MQVRRFSRAQLEQVLPDVARLRMRVFRDWPYLYDGTFEYEHRYLESFRESAGAVLIGAFEGGDLVGVATGAPLEDHAAEFGAAFAGQDVSLDQVFYCAESVLLPQYRGRGVGHQFFDLREAAARALGRKYAAFCAVERPLDHPLRPSGARSLEPFWRGRGYVPMPGVVACYAWRDVGEDRESEKRMPFWMRVL